MKILVFDDAQAASQRGAALIAAKARTAIATRGRACLALSGGSMPWSMLRALSQEHLSWRDVHIFQTDERADPRDDLSRSEPGRSDCLAGDRRFQSRSAAALVCGRHAKPGGRDQPGPRNRSGRQGCGMSAKVMLGSKPERREFQSRQALGIGQHVRACCAQSVPLERRRRGIVRFRMFWRYAVPARISSCGPRGLGSRPCCLRLPGSCRYWQMRDLTLSAAKFPIGSPACRAPHRKIDSTHEQPDGRRNRQFGYERRGNHGHVEPAIGHGPYS